jgi:mRNA interferase YafQ
MAGRHGKDLEPRLREVLSFLLEDKPLPSAFNDHALSGEWSDHRDCHLKPDLLLIYRKVDGEILQLVRLGSHSELGL